MHQDRYMLGHKTSLKCKRIKIIKNVFLIPIKLRRIINNKIARKKIVTVLSFTYKYINEENNLFKQ